MLPSSVGHSQQASAIELEALTDLIFERLVPDGFASFACTRRVTGLCNEVLDDSMEYAAVVVAFQAELNKIATRFGSFLRPELYQDVANCDQDST